MSTKKKLLEAAAGNAGEAVYVDDVFSTYLYDGNGSTQTITNSIDLAGEGGLVWTRWRSGYYTSRDHNLWDTERGTTGYLNTNNTAAEKTSYTNAITYNSNGFTLNNQFPSNMSFGSETFASWTFRKQAGFFDVVTYTGNGAARTLPHNLGSVPGAVFIKSTSNSENWVVFHRSAGAGKFLILNENYAEVTSSAVFPSAPDSANIYLDDDIRSNSNGYTYVAYIFAHDAQNFGTDSDESIIKCGSYTGNGNSDGPTIDLGFEPQWVMWKRTDSGTESWHIRDVMRGMPVTASGKDIYADRSAAEGSTTNEGPIPTANGFKLVGTNTNGNASGGTYIYIAIRRPHKPAEEFAATDLFAIDTRFSPEAQAQTPPLNYYSGFPVDLDINSRLTSGGHYVYPRLTGGSFLKTETADAEVASPSAKFESNVGLFPGFTNSEDTTTQSFMWRRAPGYFDVVCYEGTYSTQTINHNLGVKPEALLIKQRTGATGWIWWFDAFGDNQTFMRGDLGNATITNASYLNNTAPTDTQITLGAHNNTNAAGGDLIAYLFATVPGISKVGSYTGTGADLNVDCGFSAGARFVLIKRTDSTGDWYVWDSVRGIVAGNDPYLLLNSTAAEVTSTDYIDPLSSGFTVTSSAPTGLNASSGTYIFYATA